jgi:cytochrome b6-f complex iron-sulfur subunit
MSDETVPVAGRSRREFCATACHATSLAAIGVLLPGCGGGGGGNPAGPGGGGTPAPALPQVNGLVTGQGVTVPIDAASPLASTGTAALVRSGAGDILVTRTAQDIFAALTAICTHEACTITGFRNATFVCPCHGSQYNTAGQVLNGPATRPLRVFPTQFAAGTLTITV